MPDLDFDLIKSWFTPDDPLGPAESQHYDSSESAKLLSVYFDPYNKPFKEMRNNPTMIVGRRGAGKTDMLLSIMSDPQYTHCIFFDNEEAAATLATVLQYVQELLNKSPDPPFVETVAELWDTVFWVAIAASIRTDFITKQQRSLEPSPELDIIDSFLGELGIPQDRTVTPYEVLICSISALQSAHATSFSPRNNIPFLRSLRLLQISDYRVSDLKRATLNWLHNNNSQAVILFDSVEALDVSDQRYAIAISGLLKCVGAFRRPGLPVAIRCCIPAESYFRLHDLSSNVLKDF